MVNAEQLKSLKAELLPWVKEQTCGPILIRLAWHDSGAFDKNKEAEWPKCGGANGSIRFSPEINHGANAGLCNAVALLEPFKAKYPDVSYADLFQMASACAIEAAGGPVIPMKYGRMDAPEDGCPEEGNLPAGAAPWPKGAGGPAAHLRDIFHRMGLTDQDIVALSGAHSMGRAHKGRSGLCHKEETEYTKDAKGTKGGASWTKDWLSFSNDYFVNLQSECKDPELLVLDTDACLFTDDAFKVFAEKYAASNEEFFADYAASHKKLSELGAKFEGEGISI